MDNTKIEFVALHGNAIIPTRATVGSAGYDVHSAQTIELPPNRAVAVPTNITAYFPIDVALSIRSRSGMAFKFNIEAFQGLVDSDYQGKEIKILLRNHSDRTYLITKGDAIAQFVFQKIELIDEDITVGTRTGGFGSTGK